MPDDFFYRPMDNLNFNPSAVDVRPLMQLAQAGQKPATKQPATTGVPQGIDPTLLQTFGGKLGKMIQDYRNQVQRYGGGQPQQGVAGQPGPIATPPMPQQQAVGQPMKIVPQGYGYQ